MTSDSAATGPSGVVPGDGAWSTSFHAWNSRADFEAGAYDDAVLSSNGGLTLPTGVTDGSWTSPWHVPTAAFTSLVPSWQAETPAGSWVEIGLQVRTATTQSQWSR